MALILVVVVSAVVFTLFQATGISAGDSGDLVTAAVTGGVAHPPGYPLYTLLGWLVSRVPVVTPAWRVALVSSIPHAMVVGLIYSIVRTITKQRSAALFAAWTIAANYLFFLYSVTPEVFALFDLFVVALVYAVVGYLSTGQRRFVLLGALVFGVALSHHHVILFFIPAIGYVVWSMRGALRKTFHDTRSKWILAALFFAGLLPYLYIPIAARGPSMVNWDHAVTLPNVIRLVTRADYGTFVAGGFAGGELMYRLLQIPAYFLYLFIDFSFIGLAFIGLGAFVLFQRNRQLFLFLTLGLLFLGPFFLFYAGFPLINRFAQGTYERFLLPSYMVVAVLLGVGYSRLLELVGAIRARFISKRLQNILVVLVSVLLFLYPATLTAMTFWRFWGLPNDKTGDRVGRDILSPLPRDSILILTNDTSLFTTQYVRYALGYRPDVAVLHLSLLGASYYRAIISRNFPNLRIPTVSDDSFIAEFIAQNAADRPIFSNSKLPLPKGRNWVPFGLVYQLYATDDLPAITNVRDVNKALWRGYQDPTRGILSRYNHLMLSDVRDVYAAARISYGKTMFENRDIETAQAQFQEAVRLEGDSQRQEAYMYLGLTHLFQDQCDEALDAFARVAQHAAENPPELSLYRGVTYRDCLHDEKRARVFFEEYEKRRTEGETPLEQEQQ